jgi:hypothetical protein
MGAPTERRFTLADGLALVAATAAGLALMRVAFGATLAMILRDITYLPSRPEEVLDRVATLLLVLVMSCLATWTVAVALLVLRRPRPGLRRLVRRPGAMACLAAGVATLANLAIYLAAEGSRLAEMSNWAGPILVSSILAGTAVASCWLTMAASGRWRAERAWLDRLGRALGFAWLASYPLLLWLAVRYFVR